MDPIGLYLHIPYCLHKCGYCDFNSHNLNQPEMEAYVTALLREMGSYARGPARGRRVETVFFGGGTPTTLPAPELERFLSAIRRAFHLDPQAEITLEANPATLGTDVLHHLHRAGFNRISIGVQSFHTDELKVLDRVHTVEEVYSTVDQARAAGFDNLSLDLMFGLPGQTRERWQASLERAISLKPDHLSAYNLTIEPGTSFYKLQAQGKLPMPDEDFQLELYRQTMDVLGAAGFRHYEISNYTRPGRECRHNLLYWNNGDYLGLGAGAASYLNGQRWKNHALPARYIREVTDTGRAVAERETPDVRQSMGETLMLGLRLKQGVDLRRFERRFKVPFVEVFGETAERLRARELVTLDPERITLTPRGLFLADSVILEFIA